MAYNQNNAQRSSDNIHFDMMEHIGVLAKKDNGWTKEVNIVAWNGGKAKVDIREWDPNHERMTKGITLFEDEAEIMTRALARRYGVRYSGKEAAGEERHEAKAEPARDDRPDVLFDEPAEDESSEQVPFEEAAAELS